MWLKKLKIALIEKDTTALDKLLDNLPELTELNEIQEAVYLLDEATQMMKEINLKTSNSMKQLKNNLDYLKSTAHTSSQKLDLTT